MHDIAEAATLLEPKTKELLRAALNEMWQAELHLRSAQPRLALPFEYRALALIESGSAKTRDEILVFGIVTHRPRSPGRAHAMGASPADSAFVNHERKPKSRSFVSTRSFLQRR